MQSSSNNPSTRCDTPETVPRPPAQPYRDRYSALMKPTKHIHLLLASLLVASVAFAQTKQAADSAPEEEAISAARSQYAQAASVSSNADNKTLAQFPRGGPERPFPPRGRYSRERYETPWMDHGGAGPILIGAAIGFAVGAALGASQSAHNGTPVSGGIIFGGGILGFLGGCVGKAVSTFPGGHYSSAHRRRPHRPSSPEDDEESNLGSHPKAREGYAEAEASASPNRHHESLSRESPVGMTP
jgi:hypothetical protein